MTKRDPEVLACRRKLIWLRRSCPEALQACKEFDADYRADWTEDDWMKWITAKLEARRNGQG